MHESLKLFREICNNKWFIDTNMILFLNKKDLFEEKIKNYDLSATFPDYKGGKDFDNATKFIKEKFLQCNEQPSKKIYPHVTIATNTKNVELVFNICKDIILHQALERSGLGL